MGGPHWFYCVNAKGFYFYFFIHVDSMDHSAFSLRSINEFGLEGFIAFGPGKYAHNRGSGFIVEEIMF